ncbi:hypothetical protein [Flavobacterium aquicola]|uniref:Uncharacterized protein n=1 Tax=Flavobacterium aquicola TaxID=1682742 RepID=A0A3E0EMY1_9FLAO|nr:hypothetical protein [Flavobacterium aquicola]REG98506.1 hypothetical protein C8P67_106104 [Flavobacterium aquicola]
MFSLAQMVVASCVPGVQAHRYNGQLDLAPEKSFIIYSFLTFEKECCFFRGFYPLWLGNGSNHWFLCK